MQGAYGGLVIILNYSSTQQADLQEFSLITQLNQFILTQNSDDILAEVPV